MQVLYFLVGWLEDYDFLEVLHDFEGLRRTINCGLDHGDSRDDELDGLLGCVIREVLKMG